MPQNMLIPSEGNNDFVSWKNTEKMTFQYGNLTRDDINQYYPEELEDPVNERPQSPDLENPEPEENPDERLIMALDRTDAIILEIIQAGAGRERIVRAIENSTEFIRDNVPQQFIQANFPIGWENRWSFILRMLN
jgi:hypothetical protein